MNSFFCQVLRKASDMIYSDEFKKRILQIKNRL